MSIDLTSFLNHEPRHKEQPPEARTHCDSRLHYEKRDGRQTYTRWIRWPLPPGQRPTACSVEVVGTFTDWRKVPLVYDKPANGWNLPLRDIVANRTHRYVILVDGKPSYDSTCDGLVVPQGPDEAQYQISTPKGPRVMLMFGQTK